NEVFQTARRHGQHATDFIVLFRLFAFGWNLVNDDYGLAALYAETTKHALKNHLISSEFFCGRLCERIASAFTNGCDHLAVLGAKISSPRIQSVAAVVLLLTFA